MRLNKTVMTGHGFGHFQVGRRVEGYTRHEDVKVSATQSRISPRMQRIPEKNHLSSSPRAGQVEDSNLFFHVKNPISPKRTLGYPHEGPRVVCHFRNLSNWPVVLFQVEDTNLFFHVEDTNLFLHVEDPII